MSELTALPNFSNVERYSVTTPVTSFFSLPHISSARQRNNPFMHIDKLIRSGDVWAMGEYFSTAASSYQTLIEQCMAC